MPYICILYVLPYAFHCAEAPVVGTKRKRLTSVHSTGAFSIHISNEPDLWYYCIVVRQVGFSLCSQMWHGYLSPVVSSLNAPAVTLRMSVSSLFLVLQTVLDRGALKCIYKRQEIATFRWRDIKYRVWIHVWTGLVFSMSAYVTEFFFADKA